MTPQKPADPPPPEIADLTLGLATILAVVLRLEARLVAIEKRIALIRIG